MWCKVFTNNCVSEAGMDVVIFLLEVNFSLRTLDPQFLLRTIRSLEPPVKASKLPHF